MDNGPGTIRGYVIGVPGSNIRMATYILFDVQGEATETDICCIPITPGYLYDEHTETSFTVGPVMELLYAYEVHQRDPALLFAMEFGSVGLGGFKVKRNRPLTCQEYLGPTKTVRIL